MLAMKYVPCCGSASSSAVKDERLLSQVECFECFKFLPFLAIKKVVKERWELVSTFIVVLS